MTETFIDISQSENRQADLFRGLAVAALVVAVIVAGVLAATESNLSWGNAVTEAIIDVPLLAATYYFSSESRDHRGYARRAREWSVRFNTIVAYTSNLTTEAAALLLADFGSALYREPTLLAASATLGDAQGQLLEQIANLVKTVRG